MTDKTKTDQPAADGLDEYLEASYSTVDEEMRMLLLDCWNAALASRVKVKPLVWVDHKNVSLSKCGRYQVKKLTGHRREIWRVLYATFGAQYVGDYAGKGNLQEAAKAAAQAHHDKLVLSQVRLG